MVTFQVSFYGRTVGAIGSYSRFTTTVPVTDEAAVVFREMLSDTIIVDGQVMATLPNGPLPTTLHDVVLKMGLYDKYEHISGIKITEQPETPHD